MTHCIRIRGEQPAEVPCDADECLGDALSMADTPVLLGCRTGICGTCLVEVVEADLLPPPGEEERETLDLVAPGQPLVRLACQVRPHCDLTITPLKSQ